jgi:hypothetical protein
VKADPFVHLPRSLVLVLLPLALVALVVYA